MESKSREQEQFESWFKFHAGPDELHMLDANSAGTNYLHPHTDIAWIAWQASRAALVVELPESDAFDSTWQFKEASEEALRSAGITVKGEWDDTQS